MDNAVAVIFGATGQDGSYLSELLLKNDYKVIGVCRRSSIDNTERLRHIQDKNFHLVEGDVTDASSVLQIISGYKPHECYNLAAQSHVGTSFSQPMHTFNVDAVGVLNILEAIRLHSPTTRFMQASTSEMFGNNATCFQKLNMPERGVLKLIEEYEGQSLFKTEYYQDEDTSLAPDSPYAVAKVAAHHLGQNYRRAYGLYISNLIMFNHESPRRGERFVTRKITKWIGNMIAKFGPGDIEDFTRVKDGIIYFHSGLNSFDCSDINMPCLHLGNIDAERDWGHAKDTVRAQYLSLQQDQPDDYVIATGETRSVKDFLTVAFKYIGIDNWERFIVIDPKFYRPSDVEYLCGKSDKARQIMGWSPQTTFDELVQEMVDYDVEKAKNESVSKEKVYERSSN